MEIEGSLKSSGGWVRAHLSDAPAERATRVVCMCVCPVATRRSARMVAAASLFGNSGEYGRDHGIFITDRL